MPSAHDSNPVKEARSHYFATHPWDWIHDNTDDLSDIFRELAEGAGLLGESIHEIQLSWGWTIGVEACQLCSSIPAQRIKVPKGQYPPWNLQKVMGLKGIHDPDALWHFAGYTYCPWCGEGGAK